MYTCLQNLSLSPRHVVLISLLVAFGGLCFNDYWNKYKKRIYLRKLRKSKQKQKLSLKGEFSMAAKIDNAKLEEICSMNMFDLLKFINSDAENSKLVFQLYQNKALCIDQRLNCVIEFFKYDDSSVNLTGPLGGVPVSLKDNLILKGYESYAGLSVFLNRTKPTDSCVLVKVIQQLGGIPFVKTTAPQTMMTILSSNPIDGVTVNPINRNFLPGGSSSGEGALVGAKGSVLGFGSDVGGSIRIPAAFCGIVGFKPGCGRISTSGGFKTGIRTLVKSVYGPLTRDVESAVFVMQSIYNSGLVSYYDPVVPRLPFNDELFNKKQLRIGYFVHDDSFHAMPAMKRAVEETVHKLELEGHQLVPWKPPKSGRDWWKLYHRSVSVDGLDVVRSLLESDKIDFSVMRSLFPVDITIFDRIKNFIKFSLPDMLVNPDEKLFYWISKEKLSANQVVSLMAEIEAFKTDVISDWDAHKLDAVLCPAGGFTALPVKSDCFYYPFLSYVFLWNLLDFPAGVVPVTRVTKDDLTEMATNEIYRENATVQSICQMQKDTLDMSVSVQCVSLPWQDEMALNLMKKVQSVVRK